MDFVWLKSTIPIKSYDGQKIEFSLKLCLVRVLHWNVHNIDFLIDFLWGKTRGPNKADFYG